MCTEGQKDNNSTRISIAWVHPVRAMNAAQHLAADFVSQTEWSVANPRKSDIILLHCLGYTGYLLLLEILEISLNLYGPPGNFCVKCWWSTALVSSHDITGYYWIAYLRNWSPFFIFAAPSCCAYHVFVLYLGKLVDSVQCIAGRNNANMSWIFLEIPPGISWKFVH